MPSTRPAILTHLPPETKAEIQRRALALDRSMAWWVHIIQPKPTTTCCDDAERGAWCPTCGRSAA